jgi:hypothetical protein
VRDLAKLAHFWQLEREIVAGLMRGFWGGLPKSAILMAAGAILGAYVAVMLLGVMGAAAIPPANWRMHCFLLLLIAFVCGIHTLVFGHSRYHLPLMPLVGMYAAAAVTNPRRIVLQWREPQVLLAGGVCLLLMSYWCYELMVESSRF